MLDAPLGSGAGVLETSRSPAVFFFLLRLGLGTPLSARAFFGGASARLGRFSALMGARPRSARDSLISASCTLDQNDAGIMASRTTGRLSAGRSYQDCVDGSFC